MAHISLRMIPLLPLSALCFYLFAIFLSSLGRIPDPVLIISFLKSLYLNHGFLGLFLGSFLEGLAYIGLYFPGSLVVALAVILSDGAFSSFVVICCVVSGALVCSSIVSYLMGRIVRCQRTEKKTGQNNINDKKTEQTQGRKAGLHDNFRLALLHPNTLGFHFFEKGLQQKNIRHIGRVFPALFLYGMILSSLIYPFKSAVNTAFEGHGIVIILLCLRIVIEGGWNRWESSPQP